MPEPPVHYSPSLIAFDEITESFRSKAYPDGNKPDGSVDYACGFGTHAPDVNASTTWTRDYATARLIARLNEFCTEVNRAVKVSLAVNEIDALTSFAYNMGMGHFSTSTLLRLLNAGDKRGAADEFLKWKWKHLGKVLVEDDGLYARRVKERAMFLAGDWYAQLELPKLAAPEPAVPVAKPKTSAPPLLPIQKATIQKAKPWLPTALLTLGMLWTQISPQATPVLQDLISNWASHHLKAAASAALVLGFALHALQSPLKGKK